MLRRAATPGRERALRVMTWLADEKILLGLMGLFWLNAPLRPHRQEVRHEANRMVLSVGHAGLLPDVFKHFVNRKRPDRALVHGPRKVSRGPETHGTPSRRDMR
jgi:hypothetical protein